MLIRPPRLGSLAALAVLLVAAGAVLASVLLTEGGDGRPLAAATTATTPDAAKSAGVSFVRIYTLTTTAGANGRLDPAPGRHAYDAGSAVTLTATPDAGYQVAAWEGACRAVAAPATTCTLTMDADKTAGVTFVQVYTLTVTVTGDGTVTPSGTATHPDGAVVTLQASWNDTTHAFTGWGGACSGSATSCELTMDADTSVTATFAALTADRCATPGAADCLRAVYRGAPGDYAQVSDIPADVLVPRGADGRYTVARDQQITVVTAAPVPAGYTRFYLQWTPLGRPYATSATQLIPPVGTTFTFTPTADAAGPTLITFDLHAARPHPVRPSHKPELGDVIVTTVFQVAAETLRYTTLDTTGAVGTAGSYAFLEDPDDTSTAVTTYEGLRDGSTTALLVHKADGYGTSQAARYDAVETGDLVEWRQAADCFVRYQVTEVKPDPTGTVPQKLLDVAWMTYAFAGCSGTIATTTAATLDWSDLPDLGGTSLTTPVRHGPFQLLPEGWTGVQDRGARVTGGGPIEVHLYTKNITEARLQPYWREPALPDGWRFWSAGTDTDIVGRGFHAGYQSPSGGPGLDIYGFYPTGAGLDHAAAWRFEDLYDAPPPATGRGWLSPRRASSPGARPSSPMSRRGPPTTPTAVSTCGSMTRRPGRSTCCSRRPRACSAPMLTPSSPSPPASSSPPTRHEKDPCPPHRRCLGGAGAGPLTRIRAAADN